MKLISFLGRNTQGILEDAFEEFGERVNGVLVISRDGDQMEAPAGLTVVPVSEFSPDADEQYLLIANGGTSAQLLPVVKRLVEAGALFEAYDLQRDGIVQVW